MLASVWLPTTKALIFCAEGDIKPLHCATLTGTAYRGRTDAQVGVHVPEEFCDHHTEHGVAEML